MAYLVLFFSSLFLGSNMADLQITIHGTAAKGTIYMVVFRPNEGFPEAKNAFKKLTFSPKADKQTVLVKDIPVGNYAFALYQDLNMNGKIDKNMIGKPTEPYAFSKNFKPRFAAPDFEDCRISVHAGINSHTVDLIQ